MLEHAQFIHKIDIYIENNNNNNEKPHLESSIKSQETNKISEVVNQSKDQIFIDVIPSDSNSIFLDRNQSYNITVSSTSDSSLSSLSSMSSSHEQTRINSPTQTENVNETKQQEQKEIDLKQNESSQQEQQDSNKIKLFVDHNDNTSSSCDSGQIKNVNTNGLILKQKGIL